MAVNSKFKFQTISTPCNLYVHPWTNSCSEAWTELFFSSITDGFRINMTAYVVALIMRGRMPSQKDIKHTILGILQSSFFLSSHAFGYALCVCSLRKLFGHFNVLTASFIPSFLSSIVSILIERPSRRGLLSLYVTNVASETLFHMAVWRGWVKPIKFGEVIIFTTAVSFLLYCYRTQINDKDAIYSLLRFFIGPCEEQGYIKKPICSKISDELSYRKIDLNKSDLPDNYGKDKFLSNPFIKIINHLKSLYCHSSCPHNSSCVYYCIQGFLKLFSIGYGLQLTLKLLLHMKKLMKNPSRIPRVIFNVDTMRLGAFFGGFSGMYRMISCILRRHLNADSQYIAIPAGFISGLSFFFFRDNTVALYVMWKALQILYVVGVGKGIFPDFPRASIFFHCFSTAVLFHAALLEPHNLRSSYWKFLFSMSGGRIADMNRNCLDAFGLQSSKSLLYTLNKHKIVSSNVEIPRYHSSH